MVVTANQIILLVSNKSLRILLYAGFFYTFKFIFNFLIATNFSTLINHTFISNDNNTQMLS